MEFKEGDRVYYEGNEHSSEDCGVVFPVDGSIYSGSRCVWVKWDSDGKVQHIEEDEIEPECGNKPLNEQEAVMLLLSLGYTVSKNKK